MCVGHTTVLIVCHRQPGGSCVWKKCVPGVLTLVLIAYYSYLNPYKIKVKGWQELMSSGKGSTEQYKWNVKGSKWDPDPPHTNHQNTGVIPSLIGNVSWNRFYFKSNSLKCQAFILCVCWVIGEGSNWDLRYSGSSFLFFLVTEAVRSAVLWLTPSKSSK